MRALYSFACTIFSSSATALLAVSEISEKKRRSGEKSTIQIKVLYDPALTYFVSRVATQVQRGDGRVGTHAEAHLLEVLSVQLIAY